MTQPYELLEVEGESDLLTGNLNTPKDLLARTSKRIRLLIFSQESHYFSTLLELIIAGNISNSGLPCL